MSREGLNEARPILLGYAIASNQLIIWGHNIEKFIIISDANTMKIGVPDSEWTFGKVYPIDCQPGDFITKFAPFPRYESVRKLEGDFTIEEIANLCAQD